MCCTWLAEKSGHKNYAETRHLRTIAQLCRAMSLQLRHVSTIGKKILLISNISSTSPRSVVNFDPLMAEIGWRVWGTPANFSGFCIGTLYIHFWGLLHPNGILPTAKFTLHPSLAFCCIGSIIARHSSTGHQPNVAVWYKEWNYGTFAHCHFKH